jgi:hypothetical protein
MPLIFSSLEAHTTLRLVLKCISTLTSVISNLISLSKLLVYYVQTPAPGFPLQDVAYLNGTHHQVN